jgi:threonyl-tRNA synthetase
MNIKFHNHILPNNSSLKEIMKYTELKEKPLGFIDSEEKIHDFHAPLHDITIKRIISNGDARYMEIVSCDTSLLLAFVLVKFYKAHVLSMHSSANTFSCDFECPHPISSKDFRDIEDLMKKNRDKSIEKSQHDYSIDGIDIRSNGPHSFSTENISDHLMIDSVSGLFTKTSESAQRIAGSIYPTEKELKEYITFTEEAKQYDHRNIGVKLGFFRLDSNIMPGMITWLPKGVKIIETIKSYIRNVMSGNGYKEVITPPFADICLWKKSGHWDMYKENMFSFDVEERHFALKPMNCPLHIEIFKDLNLSYKNLPYKISEFGFCNRYESSGSLHGLFRARGFTQDDSHVFCEESQIEDVVMTFCNILREVYKKFGFTEINLCLSTRPEKFTGNVDMWESAESSLSAVATKFGFPFKINEGDGAFYGPKLDFYIKDKKGRVWQCGTVQLDFNLPSRLGATYVDKDGEKKTPVMIHHAVLGSIERFTGILIENTKGRLPFWLSPIQVSILSIGADNNDYCKSIDLQLNKYGIRSVVDFSNETISYKIRHWWSDEMVPVSIIIGKAESDSSTVSVRINGESYANKMSVDDLIKKLKTMEDEF